MKNHVCCVQHYSIRTLQLLVDYGADEQTTQTYVCKTPARITLMTTCWASAADAAFHRIWRASYYAKQSTAPASATHVWRAPADDVSRSPIPCL